MYCGPGCCDIHHIDTVSPLRYTISMTTDLYDIAAACIDVAPTYATFPLWKTYPVTIEKQQMYVMRGIDDNEESYINFLWAINLPSNVYVLAGDDDTYGAPEGLRIYI